LPVVETMKMSGEVRRGSERGSREDMGRGGREGR
jgi:hypothetical protein